MVFVTVFHACFQRNKTHILWSATRSTSFIATTTEATREVAQALAVSPLLRWPPKAAAFVAQWNRAHVVTLNTMLVLGFGKTRRAVGRTLPVVSMLSSTNHFSARAAPIRLRFKRQTKQ